MPLLTLISFWEMFMVDSLDSGGTLRKNKVQNLNMMKQKKNFHIVYLVYLDQRLGAAHPIFIFSIFLCIKAPTLNMHSDTSHFKHIQCSINHLLKQILQYCYTGNGKISFLNSHLKNWWHIQATLPNFFLFLCKNWRV